MLRNVIENYLTSLREVEFFGPFKELLSGLGYSNIHQLHSSIEFGKDFIAEIEEKGQSFQCCFQVKVGDINYRKFTTEVKPQLLEVITNSISHPNFNKILPRQLILVIVGNLRPPATASFEEFNSFVEEKLNFPPIRIWEIEKITSDFFAIGIEPFFRLHNSPEFLGGFFTLYSKIRNKEAISSFDITSYSDNWQLLDFSVNENRLQVWFEGYFFSKLLFDNKQNYEAVLFLAALGRTLIKNQLFEDNSNIILSTIKKIIDEFCEDFECKLRDDQASLFFGNGLLSMLEYPIICQKALELIALKLLLFPETQPRQIELFNKLLVENGSYRSISDNYGISVFFISLVLMRQYRFEELKIFLNNCCVWICDRYQENGIAFIGSTRQEEYEQILSEYLTGLKFNRTKISFTAAIILDIVAFMADADLYSKVANEFMAVNIIVEYFFIDDANNLLDYSKIKTQSDCDYKLQLEDNYASYIEYRNKNFEVKVPEEQLLLLSFLLRDRYFPQVFLN